MRRRGDCWAPRLLASLPLLLLGVYADLLSQREHGMTWPTQILLGIVALLQKAADVERLARKCPRLFRAHCKARRDIDDWNEQRYDFWDTAMRGSSALQAALFREVGREVVKYLDLKSVDLHWGLGMCLGMFGPFRVAGFAVEMEHPFISCIWGFNARGPADLGGQRVRLRHHS